MNRPAALLILLIVGCSWTNFTPSSQRTFPAKPAGCFIEILGSPPQRPYDEIGVYDLEGVDIDQADELRELVQPEACQKGADAVLFAANGEGTYVKAIAIRWKDAEPAPTAPAPQESGATPAR